MASQADSASPLPRCPSTLCRLLGPLHPIPWVGLASALFCGLVATAALVRVAPWPPWGMILFLAVLTALVVRRTSWALIVTAVLGSAAFVFIGFVQSSVRERAIDYLAVPAALVVALIIGLLLRRVSFRHLSYSLVLLLCAAFMLQAVQQARPLEPVLSHEPKAKAYNYDPVFFMKTFWLVEKHGMGYYAAWGEASREDARFSQPTTNLVGWRTPVLTRLWTILFRSPTGILRGYILGATLALLLAYALAARLSDPATALLVPAVLAPFYLAAIPSYQYLSYETWGGFFAIAAALFMSYRLERAGLALSFGAAIIREWFVSAIVGGIVLQLWRRRWYAAGIWATALGLCFLVWGLNIWHARQYLLSVGIVPTLGASGRLGVGGPRFLLHTLWYNAQAYGLVHAVPLVVFVAGLAGVVALLRRKQPFVPSLILVPVVLFLITGSEKSPGGPLTGADYGGAFLPFLAVASCCLWDFFGRRRAQEAVDAASLRETRSAPVLQPIGEPGARPIGQFRPEV